MTSDTDQSCFRSVEYTVCRLNFFLLCHHFCLLASQFANRQLQPEGASTQHFNSIQLLEPTASMPWPTLLAAGVVLLGIAVYVNHEPIREAIDEFAEDVKTSFTERMRKIRANGRAGAAGAGPAPVAADGSARGYADEGADGFGDLEDDADFLAARVQQLQQHTTTPATAEAHACALCLENAADTIFLPCGHSRTCAACNTKLQSGVEELNLRRRHTGGQSSMQCPFCSQQVTSIHKVFR